VHGKEETGGMNGRKRRGERGDEENGRKHGEKERKGGRRQLVSN